MSFFANSLWLLFFVSTITYGASLIAGSIIHTHARDPGPVVIQDNLRPGEHHLSGMVTLNSTCDELIVTIKKVSAKMYMLDFSTWTEPSVPCTKTETPRPFSTVVFAPSIGVSFVAALDDRFFPIVVFPVFPKKT